MQGQVQKVMEDQGTATEEFRQNMEFFKRNAEASTGGTGEGSQPPLSLGSRRSRVDIAATIQAPLQQAPAAAAAAAAAEPAPTQVVQQVVAQPVMAQPVV